MDHFIAEIGGKDMKKLLTMVLALVILVSMTACGAKEEATTEPTTEPAATEKPAEKTKELEGKMLGILTPNATHGFTAESIQHAEAEAKALSEEYGFEYKFITANESSEQSNGVDTILGMNPDCVVLWPITGDELRSAAQNVMDAGVPLIIYDRLIEGFTPTNWLMGDNDTIGEESGNYFNEFFKEDLAAGQVNILEFKGDSSTVPMQRSQGFVKTANPNFNIVQSFDTGWQRQTSMEHMENFLNTKSVEEIESVQGIFTHDDEIVLGVMDAIKNYDGPAQVNIRLLSGVGGRRENLELFKNPGIEGMELMTYSFSPAMVRAAVKYGVDILKGETLEDHYLLPTVMIDQTNVDDYMKSEEFVTRYSLEN